MMKIYKPKQQKSKRNLIKSSKNNKRSEIKKRMIGPNNQMKKCVNSASQYFGHKNAARFTSTNHTALMTTTLHVHLHVDVQVHVDVWSRATISWSEEWRLNGRHPTIEAVIRNRASLITARRMTAKQSCAQFKAIALQVINRRNLTTSLENV